MAQHAPVWAIGLMSGTSLDGVDAALLRTDGVHVYDYGPHITVPYTDAERVMIRAAVREQREVMDAARMLTLRHVDAVEAVLALAGAPARAQVAVVGFHGQTVLHAPERHISWQIGLPALLAGRVGLDVVADFRSADVAAGGQGAPLVPLFHASMLGAADAHRPACLLNLGGISNLTYVGADDALVAFDCGPANALLNDWMHQHTGAAMDEDGRAAAAGNVHDGVVAAYLAHHYFAQRPPKSLDRASFTLDGVHGLSVEDGAATLTALAAASVARAAEWLPKPPLQWVLCGGGAHNPTMRAALAARLGRVETAQHYGWSVDAIEAQAFAYLAVRSMRGLPTSLPSTTGSNHAVVGGAFYRHGFSGVP